MPLDAKEVSVFISTRMFQSVLLTELLRDTPLSGPLICSVVSGIVKLHIAEMLISSSCAVSFFLSVFRDCEFQLIYVHNC